MPRFTTLYSGSSGNAAVVEEEGSFLLIDVGASCRATVRALAEVGLSMENLKGVLVTHEHIDHIRGLNVFLRKYPVPLYAGLATLDALWHTGAVPDCAEMVAVDGRSEELCGFVVRGFRTSHDAVGSCGYRITTPSGAVVAFATDLGEVGREVLEELLGAQVVALEANYDREMLRNGPYPSYLKRRIASRRGHLSNDESASVVALLAAQGCNRFVFCHLSEENNHPNLVLQAMSQALCQQGIAPESSCLLQVACRHQPSPWIVL